MKLKKGSAEAKRFMAKIRAKKGKPKKISGVKKPSIKKTHTDIKSHNYKININGIIGKQIFNDYLKDIGIEIKGQNLWFKKLKKFYNKPKEFNDVSFALKYKANKVKELIEDMIKKYNFNR